MSRATAILDRFPRHLDLSAPGKLVGAVVDATAQGLDVQTTQVGRVRRAHRLGEAEQEADLLLLAGLHRLGAQHADVLRRRVAEIAAAAEAVEAAGGDPDADLAVVEQAVGLPATAFPPFPDEGTDLGGARQRLAHALRAAIAYDPWLDRVRDLVSRLVGVHRTGNGTVRGLLEATAAYVGADVLRVDHSEEGFWHMATCRDAFALRRPKPPGETPAFDELAATDLLALEENPFQLHDIDPVARRHGDRFRVLRGGFDAVPVTIVVRGIEDRTMAPMVVNLDTGFGVATTVPVPDGEDLRFERDGRVTLAGAEITRLSYTFVGGVFADEEEERRGKEFVWGDVDDAARFGDRAGTFSVTHPLADAFDDAPTFPHADPVIRAATIDRGESRWAFFVGAGTFAGSAPSPSGQPVLPAPRPRAGFFDRSVFQPDPAGPPSGAVGLEWEEREPFAVKVWLPFRFSSFDADGEVPVRELVRTLLDRHRAAGVHVYVAYADPRWTLGTGLLRDLASTDALGVVVAGTTTWESPT